MQPLPSALVDWFCNFICFPNTPHLPSYLPSNLLLSLSSLQPTSVTSFLQYVYPSTSTPIPNGLLPIASPHLTSLTSTFLFTSPHLTSPPSLPPSFSHLLTSLSSSTFPYPIPSPHLPVSHPLTSPPSFPPTPLPCQVCSESPSKDLSTKLHNMSAMFGLYYKRDGRYNKGSEMWASGLCRYLHDAYPALTMQVLKLLTEVCMATAMYGIGVFIGHGFHVCAVCVGILQCMTNSCT